MKSNCSHCLAFVLGLNVDAPLVLILGKYLLTTATLLFINSVFLLLIKTLLNDILKLTLIFAVSRLRCSSAFWCLPTSFPFQPCAAPVCL